MPGRGIFRAGEVAAAERDPLARWAVRAEIKQQHVAYMRSSQCSAPAPPPTAAPADAARYRLMVTCFFSSSSQSFIR